MKKLEEVEQWKLKKDFYKPKENNNKRCKTLI